MVKKNNEQVATDELSHVEQEPVAPKTHKKGGEQIHWMTATQMSKVFLTEFDSKALCNMAEAVAKRSYDEWFIKELHDVLSKYKQEERDKTPESKSFFEMLETLQYAIQHPAMPESETFLNSIKFLSQFRYFVSYSGTNVHAQSFMNQIDKLIADGSVKCGLLLKMSEVVFRNGQPTDRMLIDLLVKNAEHVSAEDWKKLLRDLCSRWINDVSLVWIIIEQLEKTVAKDIQEELSKLPYDIKALETMSANITDAAKMVTQKIQGRHDEYQIRERLNSIQNKYQLEKILSSDIEQIGALPKSGYAQAEELERENLRLKQQIAQLESQQRAMEQQLQGKDQEITRISQELATTQKALDEMREANQGLQQNIEQLSQAKTNSENKLQQLIAGASQIKSGLGSRGVNEYKQMVKDIEAGIIR